MNSTSGFTDFNPLLGESWCVIGTNHSGIEGFFNDLSRNPPCVSGNSKGRPERIGIISFKRQQEIFEQEIRNNDTDFLDKLDPGTPARDFLGDIAAYTELIDRFAMTRSLNTGYRQLSSGQARKLCLLAEITRGVDCLLIQSPYEGLDHESSLELNRVLGLLKDRGIQLIVTVNNLADIPNWCTHIAVIENNRIQMQGKAAEVGPLSHQLFIGNVPDLKVTSQELKDYHHGNQQRSADVPLLVLHKGRAAYGEVEVFGNLEVSIKIGQHTLITGPNGCGKSTLIQMITGDHPMCYCNNLKVLGIQRGSGESIWELKKHMGIVSTDLHRSHYIPGTVLHVILSGLFDSIGLYTKPSAQQKKRALQWLDRIGLNGQRRVPFRQLSYAEQRLVLIARALIKVPQLLILDEPTQGLDESNRKALLDLLAEIAEEKLSTIVYVSHRQDEYRTFFKQEIKLG